MINNDSTHRLPSASRPADAESCMAALLPTLTLDARARALVEATAGNAPFLARLLQKHPETLANFLRGGAVPAIDPTWTALSTPELMRALREAKARLALYTALADISGAWSLSQITHALSQFAGDAVTTSLRHLLKQAAKRCEFTISNESAPEENSGIIILGMGKLGGFELNYSSDIDLIILFDREKLPYTGQRNAQHFMNKLATDLMTLMQERTSDGYVFRTDLRLRPDPMSTPLAVTVAGALTYYETVGQNWERAAMIKARPIAGDLAAAADFKRELIPFVWRKTLDFATIADIHSIKRQMNVKAGGEDWRVPGHNIKTGLGGIREIEFFVATQQLVWGGRIPELRTPATMDALNQLVEFEFVAPEIRDVLAAHYTKLRTIEHRLQMRNDEQTHTVPENNENFHELALFCGFADSKSFNADCLQTLQEVHKIYTDSMLDSEPLAVDGNLVFTGVEADPGTLKTLASLGYSETQRISDIIQGWHRGHRRSTRSKRSRQVLTELVPALLIALGKTANPDAAFFHFDDFISRLPSGAQIFSLFHTRPEMLTLLADILGSAPALGDTLSNDPSLLDAVLEPDFFLGLPSKEELENVVTERLRYAPDYEQKMVYLRIFNNETRFQAGVHLLKGLATPKRVGAFLSDVAEVVLQSTMQEVWAEYAAGSEVLNSAMFCVLAMGKLGGREMTFGSDLDIVFLYDDTDAGDMRQHLTRISQRLVSALTLLTREGRLYEVDTRLRPGGSDGPLAVSLAAFDAYFTNSAWTYEHMALTRARVVATNAPHFAMRVDDVVRKHVLKTRDMAVLLKDVCDMRERIAKQFKTINPWALKHIRGGMVDLDFIAQYLVLRYSHDLPAIWHRGARGVFETAQTEAVLNENITVPLLEAKKFMTDLMSLQRLCAPGGAITDESPEGLKRLLVKQMKQPSYESLKQSLLAHEAHVTRLYQQLLLGTV